MGISAHASYDIQSLPSDSLQNYLPVKASCARRRIATRKSKFKRPEGCKCQIPLVQMQMDGQGQEHLAMILKAVCGSPHEPWDCLGTSGAWE